MKKHGLKLRFLHHLIILALGILAVVPCRPARAQDSPDPIGPGVAGQLHALTYHPTNPQIMYAGGDVCGVLRSTDGGGNWRLWNNGLEVDGIARSYYIDDLLYVDDPNLDSQYRGLYAATYGGIFFRAEGDSEWIMMTPRNDNYRFSGSCLYWYKGANPWLEKGGPVPFCSLAYDPRTRVLYAGAGSARWTRDGVVDMYPMDPMDPDHPFEQCGSSTQPQYSLWRFDFENNASWQPIQEVGNTGKGHVTQIAIADDGVSSSYPVMACSAGLYSYTSSEFKNLWTTAEKSFSLQDRSCKYWGVAAGRNGSIYGLAVRDTTTEGQILNPGVYECKVFAAEPTWTLVGDSLAIVPPGTDSWHTIVSNPYCDLTTIRVRKGTAGHPDEVFVGQRYSTSASGYFRYGPMWYEEGHPLKWSHILYVDPPQYNSFGYKSFDWYTGIPQTFDPGWASNSVPNSTTELAIAPSDTSRLFACDYEFPVISINGGRSWEQAYCKSEGTGYSTNGLTVMSARVADFDSDGNLLLGGGDFGVFKSSVMPAGGFQWLYWYGTGGKTTYAMQIVPVEGVDEIYTLRDTPTSPVGVWPDYHVASQILARHNPDDYQLATEWEAVSGDLENHLGGAIQYTLEDFAFLGSDTMFVAMRTTLLDTIIAERDTTISKYLVGRLLRGVRDESPVGWSWEDLDLFPAEGASILAPTTILTLKGSSRVVVGLSLKGGSRRGVACFDADCGSSSNIDFWIEPDGAVQYSSVANEASRGISTLATDSNEEFIYVGTAGIYNYNSSTIGVGTVLRTRIPARGEVPAFWDVLANRDESTNLNFVEPTFEYSYAENEFGLATSQRYTHVRDILVDPNNPKRVYAAIGIHETFHPQNGAWFCDVDGSWTQLTGGSSDSMPQKVAWVLALDPNDRSSLYIGTRGQEFSRIEVTPSPAPEIAEIASYVLPPHYTGADAVFALELTSLSSAAMDSAYVDVSVLTGTTMRVSLDDSGPDGGFGDLVADDGIWSARLDTVAVGGGTYEVEVTARDADWNTARASVRVTVAAEVIDQGASTGALADLAGSPNSVAAFDLADGSTDGSQEILVTAEGAPGQLFEARVAQSGVQGFDYSRYKFFESTGEIPGGATSALFADINNDGYEDFLYTVNQEASLAVWDTTVSKFKIDNEVFVDYAPADVYAAAWGDYNQDAWVDLILICGYAGGGAPSGYALGAANLVVYRNSQGRFAFSSAVPVSLGAGVISPDPFPYNVALGYVNDDALLDAVFTDVNELDGRLRVAINQGFDGSAADYVFADRTVDWFGALGAPAGVNSSTFADLDNDGRMDLVLARYGQADNLAFYRNTGTQYESADWSDVAITDDVGGVTITDLDLNGWDDIVTIPAETHNVPDGAPRVLLNNLVNGKRFVEHPEVAIPEAHTAGSVAFDWVGDKPSVYLGRVPTDAEDHGFFYTFAKAQDSNYFRLRSRNLNGVVNGSGIGTKIQSWYFTDTDTICQTKVISGNGGPGGADLHTLIFGMGELTPTSWAKANLSVTWPDGYTELKGPWIPRVMTGDSTTVYDMTMNAEHSFSVSGSTLKGSFQAGTEESWWVFEWDADYQTTPELDVWPISDPLGVCACVVPADTTTIKVSMPEVDSVVTPTATGLYHHRVTWSGWCCQQRCLVGFRARSILNGTTVYVGEGVAQTGKICPINP